MAVFNMNKSFQNCNESDVPGYNDCPLFLSSKKGKMESHFRDVSGNIKAVSVPPPKVAKRYISSFKTDLESREISCSKNQLINSFYRLLSLKTKLRDEEFQFYRKKVVPKIYQAMEKEHTLYMLREIFDSLDDKPKVNKLLAEWIIKDPTVNSWCPSFRKLVSNAITEEVSTTYL